MQPGPLDPPREKTALGAPQGLLLVTVRAALVLHPEPQEPRAGGRQWRMKTMMQGGLGVQAWGPWLSAGSCTLEDLSTGHSGERKGLLEALR